MVKKTRSKCLFLRKQYLGCNFVRCLPVKMQFSREREGVTTAATQDLCNCRVTQNTPCDKPMHTTPNIMPKIIVVKRACQESF